MEQELRISTEWSTTKEMKRLEKESLRFAFSAAKNTSIVAFLPIPVSVQKREYEMIYRCNRCGCWNKKMTKIAFGIDESKGESFVVAEVCESCSEKIKEGINNILGMNEEYKY